MKEIVELKKRIKHLQQSLVLMSFGKMEDRPTLYRNIKQRLDVARMSLFEMKRTQIGIVKESQKH